MNHAWNDWFKVTVWTSWKVQDWSLSGKVWGSLKAIESLIASTFLGIFYTEMHFYVHMECVTYHVTFMFITTIKAGQKSDYWSCLCVGEIMNPKFVLPVIK